MKHKIFSLVLLGLLCSIGNVWGDSYTINSTTTSSDALFAVEESLTQYDYSSKWTSYNLITMDVGAAITITNVTGATITAITAEGVADNNSNKTVNFTISDGTTSVQTSSGSWNNRKSSTSLTSKAFNSVAGLKKGVGQTYTITNMSSGSYNAGVRFVITYTAQPKPSAPTFSPAGGTVEQENSITISSTGSTSIKYQWSETEETPDSWSDYSTNVTVPSVTGTRYLYAYGINAAGDGEIAHATYSIVASRTATSLAFVSPTTTVGVDENVTKVPTLTPAVGGAIFTYESSNEEVATVDENGEVTGVGVGSATITAHYAGNESYGASDANYTINVVQSAVDTKFWTSAAFLTAVGGSNTDITESRYIDNMEIKGTSTALKITTGGEKSIDGKTVGGRVRMGKEGTSEGNYLHFKIKPNVKITYWGVRASDAAQPNGLALSFGSSFGDNEQTYSFAAGDVESMVYYYCGTENTDVYAYSGNASGASMMAIKVEPISSEPSFELTITSAGWASLYLDYPVVVPSGATAYYASAISDDVITLSPIAAGNVIPANSGVVVNASANTYHFAYSSVPETVSDNLLKGRLYAGTTTGAATGGKYYRLTWDGVSASSVGFAYGAEDGAAFSVGANQAYLVLSAAQLPTSAPMLRFEIEGENSATNIENVEAKEKAVKFLENGQIYILRDGVVFDALGRVIRK